MGGRMWKWDSYDIRKYDAWSVRTVLDIGANVGAFSVMCKVLFPVSKVFAVEPNLDAYETLVNSARIWGVKCHNFALGPNDSEMFSLRKKGLDVSGFARFTNDGSKINLEESYSVKSYLLSTIFEKFKVNVDYPYIIKVDCEGGEKYILNDSKAFGYISKSLQFAIEIHFEEGGTRKEWLEYLNSFSETHDALYCFYYRDQYRRNYVHKQFFLEEMEEMKRGQFQLVRKDWWKYKIGVPRSDGLYL